MDIKLIKEIQKEVLDYNRFIDSKEWHITLSLGSELEYLYIATTSDYGLFHLEHQLEEALSFVKEVISHDEEYMEHLHTLDKIDVINCIRGLK